MTSITLDTDETRELPENLFTPLTGYTFGGWAISSTGDAVYSDEGSFTMEPSDTELYAVWKPEAYPITYLLSEGANAAANPSSYTIEDAAITLEPPHRDGYRFLGWYSDSGYTSASAEIPEGSPGSKTFYALWRWGELTAGDTGPAGGLIFYDDEADGIDDLPGFRYLEAAPYGWYNGGNDPKLLWGGIPAGDTATGLGAGRFNTAIILSGSASSGDDDTAAGTCYNYSITTDGVVYNDWFLPSLDELELLYIFFQCEQPEYSGKFIPTDYISSSEYDFEKIWAVNFKGPGPGSSDVKAPILVSKTGAVRPVRAF
jgi:uncharacterized repeat protein (TIGR02543 family)